MQPQQEQQPDQEQEPEPDPEQEHRMQILSLKTQLCQAQMTCRRLLRAKRKKKKTEERKTCDVAVQTTTEVQDIPTTTNNHNFPLYHPKAAYDGLYLCCGQVASLFIQSGCCLRGSVAI